MEEKDTGTGLDRAPAPSPNNPTRALCEIVRAQTGEDPLVGTGRNADGSFVIGPLEETEGSR